jgi:hypothetical protein
MHLESEASFVSMDDTGFTLNWTTAAVLSQTLFSVAIRGVEAKVGSITEEMYGGDKAYTGAGFCPRGALFAGFNLPASTTIQDHNRFSLGVAGLDGNGASIWVGDTDNVSSDTKTDQYTNDSRCYVGANKDSPASLDVNATLKSWDADGFTLAWAGYAPAPSQVGYLLLGDRDPSAAVGGIAEAPPSDSEALADRHGSSAPDALALVGLAAGGALVIVAGGWYARRRWRAP